MLISCSYELKPYSTDVLMCILLIYYFIRYNPNGYWRQFIQTIIISASVMFSMPAVFVICGGLAWNLVRDFRKFFYAFTSFILFMIFYFVYHLWSIMELLGSKLDGLWTMFFATPENITSLAQIWTKFDLNLFVLPLISLSIIGIGALIAIFRDKKLVIIGTVTCTTLLIASYLHLFPFAPETCAFLIPIGTILICQIPDLFSEHFWGSKIFPIAFIVLVGYNLFFTNAIHNFENNTLVKNRLEPTKHNGCKLIYKTKVLQKNLF